MTDGDYQALRFPDYYTTLEVGKPQLPVISELVAIPPEAAKVTVTVVDYAETRLLGYKVYPFQTPTTDGQESGEFEIDRDFYSHDQFYPHVIAELGEPGIWRHIRVVNFKIYPIQHSPVTGELKVLDRIKVKLEYHGLGYQNVPRLKDWPVSTQWDRLYRSMVLNCDFLGLTVEEDSPGERALPHKYLITADDPWVGDLVPLAVWKYSRGLPSQIFAMSGVSPSRDPVEIRTFIKAQYDNYAIEYVLLVGDESVLPCYKGYPGGWFGILSDYYYALVDGPDDFPDLAVGRFSTTLKTHIDNMVNKTIAFESGPPADYWLDWALLVAHKENAPLKYQGCKQDIRTKTYVRDARFRTAYGASIAVAGG